jgi:succinate-semialdehyde dehydrogenase/glutarate-semialdehyde dehydrogenase
VELPVGDGDRKIGPAVAAGCTMLVKPAAQTPLSMYALAGIMREAGLPDGVLNVITTSRSGAVMEPLIRDPRVRKLTFTGSTAVGRRLVEQSAQQLLRVSMELGGNAPFLVMADADLDAAVDGAMLAKMRNMGEACTAANRFIVHESVAEQFGRRLAERMGGLKVGRGTEDGVQVGPLVDETSRDKVSELVAAAVGGGAKVLTGADTVGDGAGSTRRPCWPRCRPTPSCSGRRSSARSPRSPPSPPGRGHRQGQRHRVRPGRLRLHPRPGHRTRPAERLDTGMVGINQGVVSNPAAPFGGVKHSGFGREGGTEGIEEYLETRYVGIRPA